MNDDTRRYGIDELADLAGVSRRTIRFYVQEGLLPAPLGVGRGRHYDRTHLERLIEVKALQESGRSLDDIKSGTAARAGGRRAAWPRPAAAPRRSAWHRLEIAPGVELHLSSDVRIPPEHRLDELVAWCRSHLLSKPEHED